MMKKLLLALIVFLVIPFLSSCDFIKAGYQNPITKEVYYGEDNSSYNTSAEKEDESLGEEVLSDIKDVISESKDSSDVVNANIIKINGIFYDLSLEPKTVVGMLVKDGHNVKTIRGGMPKSFDQDGEISSSQSSAGKTGTYADLYAEIDWGEKDDSELRLELLTANVENYISQNGKLEFETASGLTEETGADGLNSDFYRNTGLYGIIVAQNYENYAGIIIDGIQVRYGDYEDAFSEFLNTENITTVKDWLKFLSENKNGYRSLAVNIADFSLSDEYARNICLCDYIMFESINRLKDGEISLVILESFEPADQDTKKYANIGWYCYSLR